VRFLGAVVAVMAAAVLAAPMGSPHPVGASCVAPALQFKPARVARGGELTITGQNLGDDCLDTGTLPPGVGALGQPMTGLVIVIDQADLEFVVATGSADSHYGFRVKIVVPAGLAPGDATVQLLGAGDARLTTDVALVISNASPIGSAVATVATFGPQTTPDTEPLGSSPPIPLPAEIPDEPSATTPTLSTTAIVDGGSTTGDLQRAIAVGVAGIVAIGATVVAVRGRWKRRGW
jgi:hypothetical protein